MQEENEITINDLKEFYTDNDMIMETLEKSATEVTEVLTNSMLIKASIEQMIDIETSLINVRYWNGPVDIFTEASNLNKQADDLATSYAQDAQKIAAWLVFAERRINGYISDEEANDVFNQFMQGLADNNAFWIVQAALQGTAFQSLSNILAYGTDISHEGGTFAIGDATQKFLEHLGFEKNPETQFSLHNTTIGTIIVFGFTVGHEYFTDKGVHTEKDIQRIILDAGEAGANYAAWTSVVALAGGTATVPVVLLAAGTTMVLSKVMDGVVGTITGDKIVDEYDSFILEKDGTNVDGTPKYKYKYEYRREDGTTYFAEKPENANDEKVTIAIPKNGTGKDGTYDVLIEKYENNSNLKTNSMNQIDNNGKLTSEEKIIKPQYSLNGEKCTEQYYKKKLYDNWEEVCQDVKEKYNEQDLESFNKFLNDVKNASSQEEREKMIKDFKRLTDSAELYPENLDSRVSIYRQLINKGFDLNEYVTY